MLSEEHPERQDQYVAKEKNAGKKHTALSVMNACALDFLLEDDRGRRFLGQAAEGTMPARSKIWPDHQNEIVPVVVQMLRLVVTNDRSVKATTAKRKPGVEERQRQKAEERPPPHSLDESLSAAAGFVPPAPFPNSTQHPIGGNRLDLTVEDYYPPPWRTRVRVYDGYNQHHQLDILWAISGLQADDWQELVTTVEKHYQVWHGGGYRCGPVCETREVQRILSSEDVTNLHWRIGRGSGSTAQREFASSIIRDISRIIRESRASRSDGINDPYDQNYSFVSNGRIYDPYCQNPSLIASGRTYDPNNQNEVRVPRNRKDRPIHRIYDDFNQNDQLDDLWCISGLRQIDWRGLVAAVDRHYQIWHRGGYLCSTECETREVQGILRAGELMNLHWRIWGGSDGTAQLDFASSITRELFRIMRETLVSSRSRYSTSSADP